jgi:hypothetical protein
MHIKTIRNKALINSDYFQTMVCCSEAMKISIVVV